MRCRCRCYHHRLANAVKPMPTNPIVASNFKLVGNGFFQHAQIDFHITNSAPAIQFEQIKSNSSFSISNKRNFMVASNQCLLNGCWNLKTLHVQCEFPFFNKKYVHQLIPAGRCVALQHCIVK